MRLFSYRQLSSGVSDKKEWVFNLQEVIPTGHKRTVRSVAWSPNGQVLATASFDSTVGLWERIPENIRAEEGSDGPEWECFGTLEGHDSECKSVAFSYNGNLLASCGRDKSVWVWEAQPDADYECIGVLIEHSQDVKCVLWHPKEEVRMASDSKYSLTFHHLCQQILASASYDNTIKMYVDDPSCDWYCYTTLQAHSSTVWSLSFSPCGQFLASSSDDMTIWIWRRVSAAECVELGIQAHGNTPGRSGERWVPTYCIQGHFSGPIFSVNWAPGDSFDPRQALGKLVAAGADGKIIVFFLVRIYATLRGTYACAQSLEDNNPSRIFVHVGAQEENAHGSVDVNCVKWVPMNTDGSAPTMIASAGDDGEIRIWT